MTVVERMLCATKDLWTQYTQHPFVLGIQDGTLSREKFRHYILQDYLYLLDYTRVFAIGLAKARTVQSMRQFAASIQAIAQGEMDIHNGYMGRFAVPQSEVDAILQEPENRSYTSYMLRVAWEEGEAETWSAILSCALSYEYIAKTIVTRNTKSIFHPFYGDWLRMYTGEAYIQENQNLVERVNRMAETCTDRQIAHLVEIFVACSQYEMDFWNMAWRGPEAV